MFSIMQQEKTSVRDAQGGTVFRRLYLCDTAEDIPALPRGDAPGSAALVAAGGGFYLLDHNGMWQAAGTWSPPLPGGGAK